MEMRILLGCALGIVLGTSAGVHGEAVQGEASNVVNKTTATLGAQPPPSFTVQDTVTVTRSVVVNPSPPPKTSPNQTKTMTKSTALADSSTSSTPSPTPNPFKTCWATAECKNMLAEFALTFHETGQLTDPNEHDPNGFDQSHSSQRQLCKERRYENVVIEKAEELRPMSFLTCMACFKQAGLDTNTANSPTLSLIYKIEGFCYTNWPNEFDLLNTLLDFMSKSAAPASPPELPAEITGQMPSLRTRFTWTSDMNRKTTSGEAPASTSISTTNTDSPPDSTSNPFLPWLGGPLTPGAPLPTELLAQVPENWPYTEYGMLYKAGLVTSMPLTAIDPLAKGNSTQTVAWLYHSLVWNPRPLYTPLSARSQTETLFQPLLDSWTRSATWATAQPSATRDTTLPTATSGSSQSTNTQQTSQAPGQPYEPTITQLSVLPMEPDTPAEISYVRSQEAERSKSRASGQAAAMGPMSKLATAEDEGDEYRDLMDVIASMRSRLDERN